MTPPPARSPDGWGQDSLTDYFDSFRGNQFATFDNKRPAVADLIRIDGLFVRFLHGATNPRPFVPMTFMLRAHAAYRAAAGAVLAGQLYEAQAMLRLCLEHAAYGFYIGADKVRWQRWMNRNDSAAAKHAVRDDFTHNRIRKHIKAAAATIGGQFERLYETLIDFGAHPNEQGFSINSAIRKDGENVHFDTIYLQADGMPLDMGLKMTGQVGLWALHIMQLIYAERFELQGIRADIEEIRTRF
ncbi:hypothetical protein [Mesorhizobium sp. M0698]|uniref:hypothetical protein n=1 Tax=Mesorhizobium sp. M0698 TaxID=2956987 RepID=UPI00333854CF